jgi:hypothetical protein
MMKVSSTEAAAILDEGQGHIDRLTAGVPDVDASKPATIGGGDWSLKDLVGHLAHWEELALETLRRAREDGSLSRVALDDVDAENAADIERKAEWDMARVRTAAAATHAELVNELRGMSDEEWRKPLSTGRANQDLSIGDMLGSVLGAPEQPFRHVWAHLKELEDYASSRG